MYMLKISIPRKHLVSYSANVDVLYIAISETIGRWHEASGLLLLRQLAHDGKEVINRLLGDLDVNDKTRTAELEGIRKVLSPLGDLVVCSANRGRIIEHLRGLSANGQWSTSDKLTIHVSAPLRMLTPISRRPFSSCSANAWTWTSFGKL